MPQKLQTTRRRTLVYAGVSLLILLIAVLVLARPGWVKYSLWQARRELAERKEEKVIARLARVEELDPNQSETQFLMARAYRRLGKMDRMRACLLRARDLGHPVEVLKREETLALAQSGQLHPRDPDVTALMADARRDSLEIYEAVVRGCLETFQVGPAVVLLDAWRTDYPHDPQPHFYRGVLAFHRQDWPEAQASLRAALNLAPQRRDVRLLLADAFGQDYQYREALKHYRLCLEQEQSPQALFGVGKCLEAMGETDEARRTYVRLLDIVPDHYEGRLALGRLDFSFGDAPQAVRWLEPAAAARPYEFEVRHALAWALQVAGEKDRAREHFLYAVKAQETLHTLGKLTRRVEAEPDNTELRYRIGAILLERGQASDGLAWLTSVLQLQPGHPAAHRALADYYARQGKHELAAEHRHIGGAKK